MNPVVHFEIPFDDKKKAMNFYKKVFGWQLQEMPEMNYVVARSTPIDKKFMPLKTGAINGGMYKRSDGGSKSPVIVIDVPNLDKHIKKVEEAGGKVFMPKRKVGDMGLYAQVKDTEGNIIGLWETISKN